MREDFGIYLVRSRLHFALFLGLLGLIGCAAAPIEGAAKNRGELALEMKVKAALVAAPSLAAAAIEVTSSSHTVTLGGFVETHTHRQRAAKVARKVIGVKEVVNNIAVK